MVTLRNWLRRAIWYCVFVLIANYLLALGILFWPVGRLIQRIMSATFSIILLVIAVILLLQAIDSIGLLFEAGVQAKGAPKRMSAFLLGGVLMLCCGALVWLLFLRLHQPFGDFLRGSDAILMQVEMLVVGIVAWREARRKRLQQQQKR